MKPTLLYAFDTNPLIRHWSSPLSSVELDGVRITMLQQMLNVGKVDICRTIDISDTHSEQTVLIKDTWRDKLGCYSLIDQILEGLPESKVKHLPALAIKSEDGIEELEKLGGHKFIIRPIIGTRSIDAFIVKHTEEEPFRLRQFLCVYYNFTNARHESKADKQIIETSFREIGVKFLSDTSFQEYRTSSTGDCLNTSPGNKRHFFIQPYQDFDNEYRIIKAAPGQYFGYQYPNSRGWVEDLKAVNLKSLDDLVGAAIADEIRAVFESKDMLFCCSIDIGVTELGEIIVHGFSPEFMVTEYNPRAINTLVEAHLRGIVKHYLNETQPKEKPTSVKSVEDQVVQTQEPVTVETLTETDILSPDPRRPLLFHEDVLELSPQMKATLATLSGFMMGSKTEFRDFKPLHVDGFMTDGVLQSAVMDRSVVQVYLYTRKLP